MTSMAPGSFAPRVKSGWPAWSPTTQERDLVEKLAAFPVEDGPVMDALTFADMTTGPAGQVMTLDERIEEVQRRYPPDDPVHRAIARARPLLQAEVDRTRQRLDGGLADRKTDRLRLIWASFHAGTASPAGTPCLKMHG